MVVLSTLRYGETVYGSASIESVHHKDVKIALGVFPICKMENAFCEAGLPEMRKLNTTMVTTKILTNKDHTIRHFFMEIIKTKVNTR
jgi:hypothetical protein